MDDARHCPQLYLAMVYYHPDSFVPAEPRFIAFVSVSFGLLVFTTTSNCLAHHILSVVDLPYASRPCPRVALRDESSSSLTPLFTLPSFLSYSSLLLYSLHPPSPSNRTPALYLLHIVVTFCS